MVGDDPQPVGQGGDDVRAEMFRMARQDGVDILAGGDQFIARQDMIVRVQDHVIAVTRAVQHGIGQFAGDQQGGFGGHGIVFPKVCRIVSGT